MKELLSRVPLAANEQVELVDLQKHNQLARSQITAHRQQKYNLQQNQCLIVMDFSKFYVEAGKTSDLLLVLYWKTEENKLTWTYLDQFASEQQNFTFVQAVWLHLFEETTHFNKFNEIFIWSDGGPNHFKIKKTLKFFGDCRMKYDKMITYNFFASCHGHSICDSHTGVGKQKILREERAAQFLLCVHK